jgi:hypothetical protein
MMSTSIDPPNNNHNSNGRPLRIVSTNRHFTKVRTEQALESGSFIFRLNQIQTIYFSITINNGCTKSIF